MNVYNILMGNLTLKVQPRKRTETRGESVHLTETM